MMFSPWDDGAEHPPATTKDVDVTERHHTTIPRRRRRIADGVGARADDPEFFPEACVVVQGRGSLMSDKEKLHPTRPFPLHESLTNTSRKAAERPSATAAPKLMISFINFYKSYSQVYMVL